MPKIPQLAVAVVLAVWACASPPPEPPAPAPLDPVGTYSFDTMYQGQPVTGKIYVTGSAGAYAGEVVPDQGPPPTPILAVTVDAQEMTIIADAGGDDLVISMTFDGDNYTGVWSLAGDGGELTGARLVSP